ncbi:GyrI-like domain-containing protein [Cellulomonas sp. S1-8]|uniref:GyrI-like domain-containing protein n=1 Tax=Cellulomonas sp. S1-8 TaxID=2904790 RepID=UPI002242CF65|nr:GyrI-like domain-containing protein [Cellulomonas sp. S1-8]UZN02460.1 GyrI-like domain-containing protein [Cellulomonas sp. S1-8]
MKVDLVKQIESYRAPRDRFDVVAVPPLQYLMVDGHGDPNTSEAYSDALSSLFPLAYALKFLSKGELGRDYGVPPLEALWWADDMDAFTGGRDASRWHWTLLSLVPEWVTADHVETARGTVARKGGAPALDAIRLEPFDEGLAVQTLHAGPYDAEGPVLDAMHHDFIPTEGLRMTGKHHEVYLNDARRTAPDKLRTILRQPVTRLDEPAAG